MDLVVRSFPFVRKPILFKNEKTLDFYFSYLFIKQSWNKIIWVELIYANTVLWCSRTVHKVNDWLHPMQCIPERQCLMSSKIHLAVLLHLWCKCERAEDCSQFELILIQTCFIEDHGSNPVRSKKLWQSRNILKAITLWREPRSSWLQSTTLPIRHTSIHITSSYF